MPSPDCDTIVAAIDHSISQLDAHAAKGWLRTSLWAGAGAAALVAALLFSPSLSISVIACTFALVFVLVLLHNPLRRYFRMACALTASAAVTGVAPGVSATLTLSPTQSAQFILEHSGVTTVALLALAGLCFVLDFLYTRPPSSGGSPSGPNTNNHAPITATTQHGPVNTGTVQNQTNTFGPPTNIGRDLINNYGISEATLNKILEAIGNPKSTGPRLKAKNNFADADIRWNRFFTGREADLARLHTALAGASQAISHTIWGAGGVGKTELARAFAFTFSDEFDGVWWIDASDAGFSNSVIKAFKSATGTSAAPDAKPEEIALELRALWSTGRHLVILDNLDSAARLELLPPGGNFRVLATTRIDLSGAATIESFKVEVLSEDAAVELLAKQTEGRKPPHPEADLRAIARAVDCHTLAVALAGAYLAKYKDVAAADYPAMLLAKGKDGGTVPSEWGEHDPLLLKYFHSIRSCLSLHFDRFAGQREMVLLGLASFCAPMAIPLDVLAKAAKVDLATARALAGNLANLSILDYQATLSLHRLTQVVVRSMLDAETRDLMFDAMVDALNSEFDDPENPTNWPRLSSLAAHADAMVAQAAAEHAKRGTAKLANQLGLYLRRAGRYADSQRVYKVCLQLTASAFGGDHPNMAALLSNLASVQQEQGDLPGARASIERALEMNSRDPNTPPRSLAINYSILGILQRFAGLLAEARESMDSAIAIGEASLKADDPDFAVWYSNLAAIQQSQGDLPGARTSMLRAIAIAEKHFAPDHPTLATKHSNMATIQLAEGDLPGARMSIDRAIAIDQKHFAPDHPTFAVRYSNLAQIQLAQGDLPEALASIVRAIAIDQRHFAPEHSIFATRYTNLAQIQLAQGNLPEARASMELAIAINEKHFEPDHLTFATSFNNLASICKAEGDRVASCVHLKKALAILLKQFGNDHPKVVIVRANMDAIDCGV